MATQAIDLSAGLVPANSQAGALDLSAGLIPATAAPTGADQPGVLDRAIGAAKDWGKSALGAVAAPQDHKEELAATFGGPGALVAYRSAKALVDGIENTIKAPAKNYQQAKADFQRGLQDFANKDYPNLASDAASTASDIAGAVSPGTSMVTDRARQFSEGARPGGDLVTPTVKTGLDMGAAALLDKMGGGEEETPATGVRKSTFGGMRSEFAESTPGDFPPEDPSTLTKIAQGVKVAQTPAKQALRSAVRTGTETAGIASKDLAATIQNQSLRTMLDEPIAALQQAKKAVYSTVDQAAGTDLKGLYVKLDAINDRIDLTPSGSPEEAQLEAQRTSQMQTIDDAKKDALSKDVDADQVLKQGDAMHTQEMALRDLQKKVFNNQNVISGNIAHGAPETINIDNALKSLENLNRATKYGPNRLAQALGQKGANRLMDDMYAAQRLGVSALDAQQLAQRILKLTGLGGAIATGGAAFAHDLLR